MQPSKELSEIAAHVYKESAFLSKEINEAHKFMDSYVKETQRHHTTLFQPARTAQTDLVPPNGMRLPQGAVIIPEIHHLHHNDRVWENPTRFDPNRWGSEKVRDRPRGAYVPFATGPRMCIASHFVTREVKVILSPLVLRYEIRECGRLPQIIKQSMMWVGKSLKSMYLK